MSNPEDNLPPVQPPSASFLVQLFVIPLLIVGLIVLLCLMLSWVANLGSQPQELVADLRKLNAGSWQKALTIANLLTDRRHDELRRDPKMAQQLADVLTEQLKESSEAAERVKLRVYLCLALGVFEVEEGLPALLQAARQEKSPVDLEVRKTALEAITRRADISAASRQAIAANESVWEAIEEAAAARRDDPVLAPQYAQLRARAAYAMGVLGGERALNLLAPLLADADPSVRYNAATGLARHGDPRCVPRLVEMLDAQAIEEASQATEATSGAGAGILEQTAVLGNGLRASVQLAKQLPAEQMQPIRDAVDKLVRQADLSVIVRRGIDADLKAAAEQFQLAP
jgi:HEAT repeat protein